jgi:lysophospholipase L1-like esterase
VPAPEAITVYLAGDSTVTDQLEEPWSAWGQMLPRFFGPTVAIANHAESGESLRSFVAERRLEKIMDTLRAGDFLLIQFGHNDQKKTDAWKATYAAPFDAYKARLSEFIHLARERGATPVLVTSMHRRKFDDSGHIVNTLEEYPEAVRQVGRETGVPVIDLNAMSRTFYEALGPEGSKRAFVHYPAGSFPGQTADLADDTHFNAYGAFQLARCVVEGMRAAGIGLARHLVDGVGPLDPAHPDPAGSWSLPVGLAAKPPAVSAPQAGAIR